MTKEKWLEHMEYPDNVRPSMGGSLEKWKENIEFHKRIGCEKCKDRMRTKRRNRAARDTRLVMKDMGLTRVIGSVTGHVYYE